VNSKKCCAVLNEFLAGDVVEVVETPARATHHPSLESTDLGIVYCSVISNWHEAMCTCKTSSLVL
jgi:hypothetical protein